MIIISGLGSIFQSKKIAIVSLLVLLGLLIVSVWDSVLIIDTYLNDNRITLVRTVDIGPNDTLPYLENFYFAFDPGYSLIFPELPENDPRFGEEYYVMEEVLNGTFSLDNLNITDVNDRIRMLGIFENLMRMDWYAIHCTKSEVFCFRDEDKDEYGWLASVTRNDSSLAEAEKKLWPFIQQNLIWHDPYNDPINFSDYFFADPPKSPRMTAELYTSRVQTGGKLYFSAGLGMKDTGVTRQNTTLKMLFVISTKSTRFEAIDLSSAKYCYITLQIDNVGVFDKSATTVCEKEDDIIIMDDAHYHKRLLETFVKQCGCIPYSYKRQYYSITGSTNGLHRPPICDIETYLHCINKTIEIDDRKILPPCVKYKNQYQISTRWVDEVPYCFKDNDRQICPMSILSLESTADFYAVYEERYQMTPTQFVGQLGGDIGLYTGLSILSIWQMLLYLYNKYSKFKSAYKRPSDGNKSAASIRLLFYKAFVISLFKNLEESMVNVGQDDSRRQGDVEIGEKPVEQRLIEVEKKLASVEAGQEKANQKLEEHLESIAMKMQRALQSIMNGRADSSGMNKDHDEEDGKKVDTALKHTQDPDPTRAKFISSIQQKRVREIDHRLSLLESGQSKSILGMAAEDHERRLTRIETSQEKMMATLDKIAEKLSI